MAEPAAPRAFTETLSLLRELIRLLKAEREAMLAAEEELLAEVGSLIQRLLEDLASNAPGAFSPAQVKEISGLMEEARRQREQNMELLKNLTSRLESELKELFLLRKARPAYRFADAAADSSPALYLRREC